MAELTCAEAKRLIDPLIDGELSSSLAENLQRHIEDCPACQAHLAQRRRLTAMLAQHAERFEPDAALTNRLVAGLPKTPGIQTRRWWLVVPAAIAAALLITQFSPSGGDPGVQAMLALHLRSLTPDHLTDVDSSDRHTVKPWFQGKIPLSPPVPDLADEGFSLAGGRLDYIGAQQVACLVYRRRQHVINLCVWPAGSPASLPGVIETEGYHLLSWVENGQRFAAISDLNRDELNQFKSLWIDRSREPANNH